MSSFTKINSFNSQKQAIFLKKERDKVIKIKKAQQAERIRQEELRRQIELTRVEELRIREQLRRQEVIRQQEEILFRLSFNYISIIEQFGISDDAPILEDDISYILPKLSEKDFNKLNKCKYNNIYNDTCTICFDDFELNTPIIRLECNHNYHIECIHEWLCNNSNKCPLCKIPVIS
jgi:hypothetical protein